VVLGGVVIHAKCVRAVDPYFNLPMPEGRDDGHAPSIDIFQPPGSAALLVGDYNMVVSGAKLY
jgi:hypothetical protein